ncbi:unnamed protein product [Nezara viridula]|uniref:LIM zinc-binding domain-containing protein n=1 Tax=Nezara viridula TaxID=85310 RepID=A0A9P0E6D9_NEZVI|nr:unnamed protein product [Nezara viridula]
MHVTGQFAERRRDNVPNCAAGSGHHALSCLRSGGHTYPLARGPECSPCAPSKETCLSWYPCVLQKCQQSKIGGCEKLRQQERHQMLAAAYDPSRDLSPNLPCQESSDSGSGCSSSSVSSGCCKSEFTPCRDCSPEPRKEEVVCAGCHLRITDRFYLFAVDRRWHASCLQCSQCRVPLDGEVTCFARDGSIFCKKDYYR